jgi:hypothetical protein
MNYLSKRVLKSGLKGLRTTLELLRFYVAKSRDRLERIGLVPIYSFQNTSQTELQIIRVERAG